MSIYNFKFVVVNEIPTSKDKADQLSIQMTLEFGRDGWTLVGTSPIPNTNPPGMLLTFQKETSSA